MQTTLQAAASNNPDGNRCYTQAELDDQYRADIERKRQARLTARDQITEGVSPFRVHRAKILGSHSTALRLQAVVLNLYNGAAWAKKAPVRLDNLLANADFEHAQILTDLLRAYARNCENDPDFIALGRELAEARQPKARRGARA